MNNYHKFWLDRWHENNTPFHQIIVNPDLPQFWPKLDIPNSSNVLVPLCGKSLDMIWLLQQGHFVIGIELSSIAAEQFFSTNNIPFRVSYKEPFQLYENDSLQIWVGDIFHLTPNFIPPVDAIYDRGALIALPKSIRQKYVHLVSHFLKSQGKVLLKTVAYNQEEMEGPPYSVTEPEITQLYTSFSKITKVKTHMRKPEEMHHYIDKGCQSFTDETWILCK